jgi:general secretion pathway protein E
LPDSAATPDVTSLGEQLVRAGRITLPALERAQRVQSASGERLETVLTQLGLVSERDLAETIAAMLGLRVASAAMFPDAPLFNDRLNRKFLRQARLLPIEDRPDGLLVAMADPADEDAVAAVRFAVEKPVLRCVACATDIASAYERLYGTGAAQQAPLAAGEPGSDDDVERLRDSASEAPVVRLVSHLIARAVDARASDIHLEPTEDQLRVRYRIDGLLRDIDPPPHELRSAVVSRIKILAKLDISERRLPQDGRMRLAVRGHDIDFRVSTVPTIHGESVVLRVLDRTAVSLDFRELGFDEELLERHRRILAQPHGIILVTGPTGSGKTTTLYASLLALNTADRKILTIEDPVEYQLRGVNQVQVKPQIGLTFASALRSFLRQNPNVVMVGEIRDLETAQIAVQAALTGHLILSTLHTNDAASGVTRLLDMGVEDYLITSTVAAIVAQRLVRTLCPHCRQPYEAAPEFLARMTIDPPGTGPVILYRAAGCVECGGTGFHGRTSILEILTVSEAIRRLVLQHAEADLIRKTAVEEGMRTMFSHGMRKALSGVTTPEEVLRATRGQ